MKVCDSFIFIVNTLGQTSRTDRQVVKKSFRKEPPFLCCQSLRNIIVLAFVQSCSFGSENPWRAYAQIKPNSKIKLYSGEIILIKTTNDSGGWCLLALRGFIQLVVNYLEALRGFDIAKKCDLESYPLTE